MTEPRGRLSIRSSDLVVALTALKAAQKYGKAVELSVRDGELCIRRGVSSVRLPVTGSWTGTALVSGEVLRGLWTRRKAFPEVFTLLATEARLHFSHFEARASWRDDA